MNNSPDSQNLLGLCYYELGDYTQAKSIFENLLERAPLNVNILLNTAKAYAKLNDADKVLEYAEKITDTFPECEEAHELIRQFS